MPEHFLDEATPRLLWLFQGVLISIFLAIASAKLLKFWLTVKYESILEETIQLVSEKKNNVCLVSLLYYNSLVSS